MVAALHSVILLRGQTERGKKGEGGGGGEGMEELPLWKLCIIVFIKRGEITIEFPFLFYTDKHTTKNFIAI